MRLNGTSLFTSIECAENNSVPSTIQIMKVGKFNHPSYGFFEITPKTLTEFKKNFDAKVRGIDLALDYFHESDREASGWIKGLELRENDTQLWASVDWTPAAAKKLSDRELRYFSPDFTFKWQDPETNKFYSNVLFGGALTNRPFLKEMQAIVANEPINGGKKMTEQEIKDLETKNIKLSEDMKKLEDVAAGKDAQIADLQKQIDDIKAQLSAALGQVEVEMKEKVALQDQMKCQEKEQEFSKLLSEGKAVVAQKEAFLKGDMQEFIKLAQPINLKAQGTGEVTHGDDDDKVLKLAETIKKEKNIDLGSAISQALKQIKGGV